MVMDEAAIVQSQETPVVLAKDQTTPDNISLPTEHTALYELFDVKEKDPRTEDYLRLIWNYAKEVAPNKDRDSLVYEVIRLKNRLARPSLGESKFTKIVNYIKTHNQLKNLNQRLTEMENG